MSAEAAGAAAPARGSRARAAVRRLLRLGLLPVAVLALAGLTYQSVATRRDLRRYPPPGRLVEVGGRRLHLVVGGQGGPAVVLDGPVGTSSLGWALVEPELEHLTTTLAYDRAGYGWSDPGLGPRTCGRMADELHALLAASGVPPPYVLVGASLGGVTVRLYAWRYPDEVAGLVLVDPAHEDQFERLPPLTRPATAALRVYQVASRLGLMRLAGMPVGIAGMGVLEPGPQAVATAVGLRSAAVDAIVAETAAVERGFAEARAARVAAGPRPLGDRPLVVLTRKDATPPEGEEATVYAAWVELHRELAAESSRGRQEVVEPSGHFIAVEQPQVVVRAVGEVVAAARAGER